MVGRRSGGDRARLADEDLVLRIARGDERSFEVLYDRHGKVAWSLAFRLPGEREAAEDLVQEAFAARTAGVVAVATADLDSAQALALTREPRANTTAPTGAKLVVVPL